jgi:23S rRNA pseudouridine2605 synthase
LNRFLARAGVASRRAADALIASGAVQVNGKRPPKDGMLIDPDADAVTVDGDEVHPPRSHRYLLLNKPAGVMVTASDPEGRPTVFDLLDDAGPGRLFPVGRLDMATSGLLFLFDDGALAHRLTHARFGVPKEYIATVAGVPTEADIRHLRTGVTLEDGRTAPAQADLIQSGPGPRAEVKIVIREGRNRQVRRMLEAVGHPVTDLVRVGFGPIRLGRLKSGTWRRLRPAEIDALMRAAE